MHEVVSVNGQTNAIEPAVLRLQNKIYLFLKRSARRLYQIVTTLKNKRIYRRIAVVKRSARILVDMHGKHPRECPICNNFGYFLGAGAPLRLDAQCMICGSLERHRQHFLLTQANKKWIDSSVLLHFAPELCLEQIYRKQCLLYVPADCKPTNHEMSLDIQDISFPDETFDTVICHQVLEHVEKDKVAVEELFRVVKTGGRVILSVPLIWTWQETYRRLDINNDRARDLHFGQYDHVRYYGRDFVELLESAGFEVTEDVAREPAVSRFGLIRGHVILVAVKPNRRQWVVGD